MNMCAATFLAGRQWQSQDALFDDEQGYRVDRDAYALPDVHLEPDELAVVGLASRVWQQASLAGPASRALVKLKALGVDQFGVYLQHDDKDHTLQAYGERVLPAVAEAVKAKA